MTANVVSHLIALRQPTLGDAAELFALVDASRDTLRAWLPWVDGTRSVEDSCEFLEGVSVERDRNGQQPLCWLIEVDGAIGGVCDLHSVSKANHHAAIGYWLADRYVGQGVMQRALRLLQQQAFGELGLNRLVIDAASANLRSCAVAERAGFQFEGVLRDYLYLHERYWDARQYSLLASEWSARRLG